MAAMFAVYQRDQGGGGRGQVIDVSLYEPLFRLIEAQVIGFDQLGFDLQLHQVEEVRAADSEEVLLFTLPFSDVRLD